MEFRFNERKAAEAAAYLLRKCGPLTHGQLIKLLYLADRQKLVEIGTLITGDRMVSMDNGTALSAVYDIIRNGPSSIAGREWHERISGYQRGQKLRAIRDEEPEELSDYEVGVLDGIAARYGRKTFSQLRALTHGLKEWRDPEGSSATIPPERVLEVEGRSPEDIALAEENARALLAMDALLS